MLERKHHFQGLIFARATPYPKTQASTSPAFCLACLRWFLDDRGFTFRYLILASSMTLLCSFGSRILAGHGSGNAVLKLEECGMCCVVRTVQRTRAGPGSP